MARLQPASAHGTVGDRILMRRNGRLRPIDEMLLHSPKIADGWNSLLGAIRSGTTLAPALRELVILRIAVVNDAQYEWDSHLEPARTVGVTEDELRHIRGPLRVGDRVWSEPVLLALAYADTMTRDIDVPVEQFEELRTIYSDVELVELTATIAAYNMVSRFAVALGITETTMGVTR